MRRSIGLGLLVAVLVVSAGGCANKNQRESEARRSEQYILPGAFEGRLAAAKQMNESASRDSALQQTAMLAAKANYADVALAALNSIEAPRLRDDVAAQVATQLNDYHRYPAALASAR